MPFPFTTAAEEPTPTLGTDEQERSVEPRHPGTGPITPGHYPRDMQPASLI